MASQLEQPTENASDNTDPANNRQNQIASEGMAAPQESDQNGWHAEEREHKREERSYWRIQKVASAATLIFSLIAAGGAAAGAVIAFKAFKEAKRQADEAKRQADVVVSDQRPWLHIEDGKTEQITYTANGLNFTMRFIVRNDGHSPAMHAHVRAVIVPKKFDVSNEEKALCETYDFQNQVGQPIFMGNPQEFPMTLTITNDDIAVQRDALKAQGSKMVSVWMTVLASAQYDSLYDALPHHEGHAYDLNPIDITNASVDTVLSAPMGHFSILTPIIVD